MTDTPSSAAVRDARSLLVSTLLGYREPMKQLAADVADQRACVLPSWVALDALKKAMSALSAAPVAVQSEAFMYAYQSVDDGLWKAFRHQLKRSDGSICPGKPLYTHPADGTLETALGLLRDVTDACERDFGPLDDEADLDEHMVAYPHSNITYGLLRRAKAFLQNTGEGGK